jgi:hypothetical protein
MLALLLLFSLYRSDKYITSSPTEYTVGTSEEYRVSTSRQRIPSLKIQPFCHLREPIEL